MLYMRQPRIALTALVNAFLDFFLNFAAEHVPIVLLVCTRKR